MEMGAKAAIYMARKSDRAVIELTPQTQQRRQTKQQTRQDTKWEDKQGTK